jgi:hypothetical protein
LGATPPGGEAPYFFRMRGTRIRGYLSIVVTRHNVVVNRRN